MKKTIVILTILFCAISVEAQDDNYAGPAKNTVKAFWDGSAKLEQSIAAGGSNLDKDHLVNLGRKIQDIKAKDPAYNIAAIETKFKALANSLVSVQKNKEDTKQAAADLATASSATEKKVNELLSFLFDGNTEDRNPAEMKTKTQELLTLDMIGNKSALKVLLSRLKRNATEAQERYPKLEKICREETRAIEAQKRYRFFQSYQAYWDAAQKLFPEETGLGTAYSLTTNILNGIGTETALLTLVAKNYEQKVKDTRLPAAKVNDAALEKLFIDAYNSMYSESFKGKAIKAIVISNDWQIQRNELTGIVTGRLRVGAIVYKNADGQCRLIGEFIIQQEYVGNSFIGTKSIYAVGKGQEMLCENVK